MRKNIIGIFSLLLILTSCNDSVIMDFEIVNYSGFPIDSLKIEPNNNEEGKFISLKQGEKVAYKSDMSTIAKADGAYQISFVMDGKEQTQTFGYYTNGYPLEKRMKIEIRKDTLLVTPFPGRY